MVSFLGKDEKKHNENVYIVAEVWYISITYETTGASSVCLFRV